MEDNFVAAFPDVDLINLPPEFARFERIPQPVLSVYEVYEGARYEWFDGVVKDVHVVRPMTEQEKAAYDEELLQLRIAALKEVQSNNIGVTRV